MGRLIDSSDINNFVMMFKSDWGIFATDIGNAIESIVMECPTVEAIRKADYEARLKADLVAMLTEIQLEFEENTVRWYVGRVDGKSDDVVLMETINEIIQQKIDKLKGESDGTTNT